MLVVYLGLGSNLGDRMANLGYAIKRLSEKVAIKEISSIYETEPFGYKDQPLFLNALLFGETELGPFGLLDFVKDIEADLGREPSFRNAPRPVDIDILLYGDMIIQTSKLVIPHPGIADRAFILVPLGEIAPEIIHPVTGRKICGLLACVDGLEGVKAVN
ncbi:MAG: 2-amino-4-hydroxy-6-hydroxymethyldihydropteridine diphosphokinase [Dehalococcoidia bacterium]|nr:MAG: 2-amino-4-hydroxy-6-hydroxymethyldihydropteridine diphosphokinase [Dehalococcoidia bacterium]